MVNENLEALLKLIEQQHKLMQLINEYKQRDLDSDMDTDSEEEGIGKHVFNVNNTDDDDRSFRIKITYIFLMNKNIRSELDRILSKYLK